MTVAIITALYGTRSWKQPIPQRSKSFSVNPTTKNLETRRTRSNRNRDRGGIPEWTREESKLGARLTYVAALSKVSISLSKAPTPKTLPPLTHFFFLFGPPSYAKERWGLKREKRENAQEITSTKNEFCGVSLVCGCLLLEMGGKCGGL